MTMIGVAALARTAESAARDSFGASLSAAMAVRPCHGPPESKKP
jgi:hypothetical protein